MRRLKLFWDSNVGKKVVMGATGIVMVLFVMQHVVGVFRIYQSATAINDYANFLKSKPLLGRACDTIQQNGINLDRFGVQAFVQNVFSRHQRRFSQDGVAGLPQRGVHHQGIERTCLREAGCLHDVPQRQRDFGMILDLYAPIRTGKKRGSRRMTEHHRSGNPAGLIRI